jgi:ribosomal protein S18 acetylase RimI-like enzyme
MVSGLLGGAGEPGLALGARMTEIGTATAAKHLVPRMLSRLTAVEKEHPPAPDHWYLEAIGVVLRQQGRGLGSALLSRRTAQFDEQGVPAYLECSNERNLRLYERHGFRVTKALTFRSGPPQWLMWRDPR